MHSAFQNLVKRLDHLSEEFRELKEGVHKAADIASRDPEMALARARKVLELVVREVYERRCNEPAGTRPLENLIQRLVKDGHFPDRLDAYATTVRKLGNVGTHTFGEKITATDVYQSLTQLMPILEWYFTVERPEVLSQKPELRQPTAAPSKPPQSLKKEAPPQPQRAGKQAGSSMEPRQSETPARPSRQPSPSRGIGWLWTVSGLLLLVLLPLVPVGYFYGGQVIRVVTNQGQIVVEVDDPHIEVVVKEKGVVLQDGMGRREISVAAGAHELEVTIKDAGGETRLLTKKFTLSRGGKEVVNVRQELAALTMKPEPMPDPKKPDPEPKKPESEPKKPQPMPEPKKLDATLKIDLGDGVKMEFVLIDPKSKPDGGAFQMGDASGTSYEKPHSVCMVKPYYLGKYVVTQEQYKQVTGDNPSSFREGGCNADKVHGQDTKKFPVEWVRWDQADSYCAALTKQCSSQLPAELRQKGYRLALPTEAQWEYACRAGTKTRYFFGDNKEQLGDHAWFDENSGGRTHAVTEKDTSNPWGLYDMHGNVWQWCEDYYDAEYYANSPIKDPFNSNNPDPVLRVLRGGAWYFSPCPAALRSWYAPKDYTSYIGFRVCLSLD